MTKSIDLICLSKTNSSLDWQLGKVFFINFKEEGFKPYITTLCKQNFSQAVLFWGNSFPLPSPLLLSRLLDTSDDVWHGGLNLGLNGQPDFINFVNPTWMLNLDPKPNIEATSWRLSLRACLVRTDVLCQLGGPLTEFETLEAAGLELGYRFCRGGAFIRHIPNLLPPQISEPPVKIPVPDQIKFIAATSERKWLYWAALRSMMTGKTNLVSTLKGIRKTKNIKPTSPKMVHLELNNDVHPTFPKVSVLIPTLNRYPYLCTLLEQLMQQTIKPLEILIIDQTPLASRNLDFHSRFSDLPIKWFFLDKAGQSSSRNFGLKQAKGEYVLFLDDDDEVPPNLIELHLINLRRYSTGVSCGVAIEPGLPTLPESFSFTRISDVFPTNNSMICKSILNKTGLFDLAYDHGQRADHDLGTRIYLSGEKMVLNPSISVLHHHAPQGGLREHNARVTTRIESKKRVISLLLPSVSDIYLAKRYFSKEQLKEMLWISILQTFSMEGTPIQKLARGLFSFIILPFTVIKLLMNVNKAKVLLKAFPQIQGFME